MLIAIIVRVKAISNLWSGQYEDENVAETFQNFIICIEMLFFAITHYFVFSHKPYVDPAAAQAPCIHSCLRMLDVRDVADDMREHFVDPIPRLSFDKIRQRSGDKSDGRASDPEAENKPLLKGFVSSTSTSSAVENGRTSSSEGGKINDGSLSFSVLTYDGMKVQQRSQRSLPWKAVEESKEKEGTSSSSSSSPSPGSSSNDDESKSINADST